MPEGGASGGEKAEQGKLSPEQLSSIAENIVGSQAFADQLTGAVKRMTGKSQEAMKSDISEMIKNEFSSLAGKLPAAPEPTKKKEAKEEPEENPVVAEMKEQIRTLQKNLQKSETEKQEESKRAKLASKEAVVTQISSMTTKPEIFSSVIRERLVETDDGWRISDGKDNFGDEVHVDPEEFTKGFLKSNPEFAPASSGVGGSGAGGGQRFGLMRQFEEQEMTKDKLASMPLEDMEKWVGANFPSARKVGSNPYDDDVLTDEESKKRTL